MAKHSFRELRLKFLSISVIITLVALLLLQSFNYLHFRKIIELPELSLKIINSVTLVIGTFFVTSLLLRLTIKRISRIFDEAEERIFYTKIYSWSIYSIGSFAILYHFGFSLGNITLFIGLLATGLAFAVRDVLLSFFGWMILLRKKPFRIGDYIRIGEDEGKVLHIGTFFVLLDRTYELPEDYTRVPNRLFLEKSISNLGKNTFHDEIRFQLSDLPPQKSEKEETLKKEVKQLLKRTEHVNVYTDLKNEKLYLAVEYLVSFDKRQETRSKAIELIYNRYKEYIVFPK